MVAGEEPTPLEVLLAERVVACWLLVELLEVNWSARINPEFAKAIKRSGGEVPASFVRELMKMQESTHRPPRKAAAVRVGVCIAFGQMCRDES